MKLVTVKIEKHGDKFDARLFDLDRNEVWRTSAPMEIVELEHTLREKGCHPTDIHDALHELVPTPISKRIKKLTEQYADADILPLEAQKISILKEQNKKSGIRKLFARLTRRR